MGSEIGALEVTAELESVVGTMLTCLRFFIFSGCTLFLDVPNGRSGKGMTIGSKGPDEALDDFILDEW